MNLVAKAEIDVTAPASEVWKALTNADELRRWFPLEARVMPGVGGKVFDPPVATDAAASRRRNGPFAAWHGQESCTKNI